MTNGVYRIRGESDAAVVFGPLGHRVKTIFGSLNTYISTWALCRIGCESGVSSDLDVALFDIVGSSQRDFTSLPLEIKMLARAFADGYNFFLERNPDVTPRLITRMEPWHVLAFERYMMLPRLLAAARTFSRDNPIGGRGAGIARL